jgi:nitrogen fixation-related uncharacterized protein
MMFIKFWIGWALVGLALAVWLFAWSVRTRQFEEGRRAKYLPFDDVKPSDPDYNRTGRLHLAAISGIVAAGVILTGAMLVLAW